MYPQIFQLETNHCSRWIGPSGVNRWFKEFFQSAYAQTRTEKHTQSNIKHTLKSSVQPFDHPTCVYYSRMLLPRLTFFFFFFLIVLLPCLYVYVRKVLNSSKIVRKLLNARLSTVTRSKLDYWDTSV